MAVRSRPIPAGGDWLLWGDEYGGRKMGNVVLILMAISFFLLFWHFDALESH